MKQSLSIIAYNYRVGFRRVINAKPVSNSS